MKECTEFNGEMCMNAESNYYGSYGEHCIDCKDKKGDDNMNNNERHNIIKEIKNMMKKATNKQKFEIATLHKNLSDGIVSNVFIFDSQEEAYKDIKERLQKYTPSIMITNVYHNDAPYLIFDSDDEIRFHSWHKFINLLTEYIFEFYDTELIKEEYYNNIKEIIENKQKEAIKQQIKLIQNIIKEIDNIDKETNDEIWDMGVIETSFEIYMTLEKECQQILNELNINYNMIEDGNPTETIPKAIELIEEKIL